MKIFSRFKRETHIAVQSVCDRWKKAIDSRLRKFADFLSIKSEQVTRRSRNFYLGLFCVLFGSASVFVAMRGIGNPFPKLSIERISFPKHATNADPSKVLTPAPFLTEKQYQRILRFETYMDSLQKSVAGKVQYDSIITARPGLMDSLGLVEQLYRNQNKK